MYEQLKVLLHAARYRQMVWERYHAETGCGSVLLARANEQVEAIKRAMVSEAFLADRPLPEH